MPMLLRPVLLATCAAMISCAPAPQPGAVPDHDHDEAPVAGATGYRPGPGLPVGGDHAHAELERSPRHAEWQMVHAGGGDSVRVWLVYPEAAEPAPVVVVVHEIFGLSPWIRSVADRLAADGFVAVAPDLLSGENVPWSDGVPDPDAARAAIRTLDPGDVQRRLDAVAQWAMDLPGAVESYAIMGFCWGGTVSFEHAAHSSTVGTSIVYYGTSPDAEGLQRVSVPVLGLYGENDARVNATIAPAEAVLRSRGQIFEYEIYPGAGHGFLRAQDGQDGANRAAAEQAWPRVIAWLHTHLH